MDMADASGVDVFTDVAWEVWEPLIEAVRPRGKTPPKALRRTISAIFWRHQNGAKWRAIPAELGPGTASPSLSPTDRLRRWWLAAQLFIRWAKQGVWERLLGLAQEHVGGAELSMAFLDGTSIRAHAKAAGAVKGGELARAETSAKRLAALAAAKAPRP